MKSDSRDATDRRPSDKPVFTLDAEDPLAADLVRLWIEGHKFLDDSDNAAIRAARQRVIELSDCGIRVGKKPRRVLETLPFNLLANELRRRGATVTPDLAGHLFDGAGLTN